MAIIVQQIFSASDEGISVGRVMHRRQSFVAYLHGFPAECVGDMTAHCVVELDYQALVRYRILSEFLDDHSGIFATNRPDVVSVRGRIHNKVPADDSNTMIYDIYIQNGADFITIDSQELAEENLSIGTGIEIDVKNIEFYFVNV